MNRVNLHPEAAEELRQSEAFYEERGGRELAADFVARVRTALKLIARDPVRFPSLIKYPIVRKCRIARFPFTIYYIKRIGDLWVIAVAHAKRRPEYWAQRLE